MKGFQLKAVAVAVAPWPRGAGRAPPRGSGPIFRQGVRHDGVGVPVPHAVLALEHGDQLHVLGRVALAHQLLPRRDGPAVRLLDGRKVGRRSTFN